MKRIYFDHAASTPVDKKVMKAMMPYFSKEYGNASSLHSFGRNAKEALEESREKMVEKMKVGSTEVHFNSGGTESDNTAIIGIALANKDKGKHIITSAIEHHAVLHAFDYLKTQGFEVTILPVNDKGLVETETLKNAVRKDTTLVSIMAANNEIGTIQPVSELAEIAHEKGALFHTDAVQAFGKIHVDYQFIDAASAASHKIYGPKGVGLLYLKSHVNIQPLIHGGGQEMKLRSGTEDIPGIVGFAKAAELAFDSMKKNAAYELKLRNALSRKVLRIENSWLNGDATKRLAGNANYGFDYIEGESILLMLDQKGISASTGSACSTHDLAPSHVLRALGLPHEKCHGSLRISIGKDNTMKEIDYTAKVVEDVVKRLRELSPLGK